MRAKKTHRGQGGGQRENRKNQSETEPAQLLTDTCASYRRH